MEKPQNQASDEAGLRTNLGEMIRRERSALGISQDELARRCGLHRTYVSDLERGARNPSVGSILKIADALQLTAAELLKASEPSQD